MVFHNILEGHTPEEVAAAVTAFVFPDKVEMPEDPQAPKNHLRRSPLPHPLCLVLSASFCTAHGFARHVAAGCKDGGAAGEPGYGSAGWEVRERLSRLASAATGFGLSCSGELSGISKPCHQCPGNCAQGDCRLWLIADSSPHYLYTEPGACCRESRAIEAHHSLVNRSLRLIGRPLTLYGLVFASEWQHIYIYIYIYINTVSSLVVQGLCEAMGGAQTTLCCCWATPFHR